MSKVLAKTQIHSTAVISSEAQIGANVKVGPFCVVGSNVTLDDDVVLHSHVVVNGFTHIGAKTEIFPFASIGSPPQDLKYSGESSKLIIGKKGLISIK